MVVTIKHVPLAKPKETVDRSAIVLVGAMSIHKGQREARVRQTEGDAIKIVWHLRYIAGKRSSVIAIRWLVDKSNHPIATLDSWIALPRVAIAKSCQQCLSRRCTMNESDIRCHRSKTMTHAYPAHGLITI